VVLANCGGLQPPQFEMLRTFVAGGGGLLIFPGDRVNPTVYDDPVLSRAGSAGRAPDGRASRSSPRRPG